MCFRAEYYDVCYATETNRKRKLEDRARKVWHPACDGFVMIPDTDALDAYDEYILGDTVISCILKRFHSS